MDGNGRWAEKQRRPRIFGHIKGARVARDIISECARKGLSYLTLYTFSTENWRRPQEEVSFLMSLLERHLKKERQRLVEKNIRFHCIGDLSKLPKSVLLEVEKTLIATEKNTGMQLTFALNYGGRQEIVSAVKEVAKKIRSGEIAVEDISEHTFSLFLDGSFLPDPDLIIRTSGEQRLSNFLTWQSCYSEFYVTPVLWPDFQAHHLNEAISDYNVRQRRFGDIVTPQHETTT